MIPQNKEKASERHMYADRRFPSICFQNWIVRGSLVKEEKVAVASFR